MKLYEPKDRGSQAYFDFVAAMETAALAPRQDVEAPVGVPDLLRAIAEGVVDARVQRALFADPDLRARYRELLTPRAVVVMPKRMAASSGEAPDRADRRRCSGVTVEIGRERDDAIAYLSIAFDDPNASPSRMVAFDGALFSQEIDLPPLRQGRAQVVMDTTKPGDRFVLDAVRDPHGMLYFLP